MPPFETIVYKRCSIELWPDECPDSPRDWDNLGTMLCKHPDYKLGDREAEVEEINSIIKQKGTLFFPLYLLDHSGLWMRTGKYMEDPQGWDTSLVGIIYADQAKVRKEYQCKRITKAIKLKVLKLLQSEVKTYSTYIEGGVSGYVTKDPSGDDIDSCWGFYERDYVVGEAESSIRCWRKKHATQRRQEHRERLTNKHNARAYAELYQ